VSSEEGGGRFFKTDIVSLNAIREVSRAALAVYWALACYMNPDGWCWPSQKAISEKVGLGRTQLQAALKELEAKGWLSVQHSFGPPKWKHANRYRLLKYVRCGVQAGGDARPTEPGSPLERARIARPTELSIARPTEHGTRTNGTRTKEQEPVNSSRGRGKKPRGLPTGDELEEAWKGKK
jgi:hypothetical protein